MGLELEVMKEQSGLDCSSALFYAKHQSDGCYIMAVSLNPDNVASLLGNDFEEIKRGQELQHRENQSIPGNMRTPFVVVYDEKPWTEDQALAFPGLVIKIAPTIGQFYSEDSCRASLFDGFQKSIKELMQKTLVRKNN